MSRLVLVDGTFELFRGFYGAPSRKTDAGMEVAAALSVCRSLFTLSRTPQVSHLAVAFDTCIESFRNELFDGYKTGAGIEPELLAQFPLVEELCEAVGLSVHRMIEFEADDALATLAARFETEPRVDQIVIASPDKDLTQCVVGRRVITWDRIRDRSYDEPGVIERMGVRPEQVPDFLALVGDSADGIPGIPRWGAKSTAAVLAVHPHIEDIPAEIEAWKTKPRGAALLCQNLRAARDQALLYRTLATLRRDVPLELGLDDLVPAPANRARVEEVAERYQAAFLLPILERLGAA